MVTDQTLLVRLTGSGDERRHPLRGDEVTSPASTSGPQIGTPDWRRSGIALSARFLSAGARPARFTGVDPPLLDGTPMPDRPAILAVRTM
jgi:hypothetical protein